jgi:hypothetical protein
MTTEQIVLVGIIAVMGGFSLAGAIANWDWFMESRKAAFIVKILGRNGARIFYGILGAALVGFAIYGVMNPEVLHSRRLGI